MTEEISLFQISIFVLLPFVFGILLINKRPVASNIFLTVSDIFLFLVGIDYIIPNTQNNNITVHYGEVLGIVYLIMAIILLGFLLRKRLIIDSALLLTIGFVMFVLGYIIYNKSQELFAVHPQEEALIGITGILLGGVSIILGVILLIVGILKFKANKV